MMRYGPLGNPSYLRLWSLPASGAFACAGTRVKIVLPPQFAVQLPLAANLNSPFAEENVWVQTQVWSAISVMAGVVFQPLCVPGTAMPE